MLRSYNGFFLSIFSLGFFVLTSNTPAVEMGLEQGQSNSFLANPKYYTDSKYSAVTLREGYIEGIQGSWYGESSGRFIGLSGAYRTPGKVFFDGSFGVIHLIDYSGNQLDGDNQFTFTFGAGFKVEDFFIVLKERHFSNGSKFLGGDNQKNRGTDFIILYGGISFK